MFVLFSVDILFSFFFLLYLCLFVLHLSTVLIGLIKYIYSASLPAFHWHMSGHNCDILPLLFLLVTWFRNLCTKSLSLYSPSFSIGGHVLIKEGKCQKSLFTLSLSDCVPYILSPTYCWSYFTLPLHCRRHWYIKRGLMHRVRALIKWV